MSSQPANKRPPPPGAIEILPVDDAGTAVGADHAPVAVRAARGGSGRGGRWLPWVLGGILLAGVVWAFVTVRPVVVRTEPAAASLHLAGGQAWRSGDAWYLTAGEWTVTGEAVGYHKLTEAFTVSRTGVNEFLFRFDPLPGKLTVAATDAVSGESVTDFTYAVNGVSGTPDLEIVPEEAEVVVSHAEYLSKTEIVMIKGLGERQRLEVALTPRRGVLEIRQLLPEVGVWIAGKERGQGPGEWELEPGDYEVELRRSGYRSFQRQVTIESGERTVIDDAELVALPGTVSIRSTPPGAQVMLDNAVAGMAPFTRELAPGVYAVRAVLAGYHPQDKLLELKPGDEQELAFDLAAITGKLTVIAPPAAVIRIDGQVWTEGWPAELPLGPHRVEARFGDLPPAVRTVVVRPDRDATLMFSPPEEPPPEPLPVAGEKQPPASEALGLEVILVRAPKEPFVIGSPRGEPDRRANEAQRRVQLTRDYYLAAAEVTNAQFAGFDAGHRSGADMEGPQQPVAGVSWDQAARFCNYLSDLDGLPPAYREVDGKMRAVWPLTSGWRLPTEAEWEFAARLGAPPNSPYPWGLALPPKSVVANLADETRGETGKLEGYDDKFAATAPVKSFVANALGLYDLAGNVAEWVHDYYSLSTGDTDRVLIDPAGPERGVHHVVKGSSYRHYQAAKLRLALRDYSSGTRDDVGFRVTRFATTAAPQ